MHPICPHCTREIGTMRMEQPTQSGNYNLLIFSCPHCHRAIGAGLDPIFHSQEIMRQFEQLIKDKFEEIRKEIHRR